MTRVTWTIGQGETSQGTPIVGVAAIRANVLRDVATRFGGYTASMGVGGWLDGQGKLVEEPSLSIAVVTDAPAGETEAYAAGLAKRFGQSAVMMTREPVEVEFVAPRVMAVAA